MRMNRTLRALGAAGSLMLLAGFAAIGGSLMLDVQFADMGPHVGQLLEARLVEAQSGDEIARLRIDAVPGAVFDLEFDDLEAGVAYLLDVYADLNGNGTYDAPPVDHAWRVEIPAFEASQQIAFVHNTAFTDIEWPIVGGSRVRIDGVITDDEYPHSLTDVATGIGVYWSNDDETLTMGLVSPGTGWVSAGFDPENAMQGANYILLAVVDGEIGVEDHFGTSRFGHSLDNRQDVLNAAGIEADGMTTVEFSIPLDSGDAMDKALLPGERYVLLLAYHSSSDDMTRKHSRRGIAEIALD